MYSAVRITGLILITTLLSNCKTVVAKGPADKPTPPPPPQLVDNCADAKITAESPLPRSWGISTFTNAVRIDGALMSEYQNNTTAGTRFSDLAPGFVRMDLLWDSVEQTVTNADGSTSYTYKYDSPDAIINDLQNRGAKLMIILRGDKKGAVLPTNPLNNDVNRARFVKFASDAATHYRCRGVMWEIWNEPDLNWGTNQSATVFASTIQDYAKLLAVTAPAVRAADPSAFIVGPAAGSLRPDFLQGIFQEGALNYLDGVSVHPYRHIAEARTVVYDYDMLRALIDQFTPAGHARIPIVDSEWGYTAYTAGVSQATQARFATDMFLSNLTAGVNITNLYDFRDGKNPDTGLPDAGNAAWNFGILDSAYAIKPAYTAVKGLFDKVRGYVFRAHLVGADVSHDRLVFQNDTQIKVLNWGTDGTVVELAPASNAEAAIYRKYASIRYDHAALTGTAASPAEFKIEIVNFENQEANITVSAGSSSRTTSIPANKRATVILSLALNADATITREQAALSVQWNSDTLADFAPLRIFRREVEQSIGDATDLATAAGVTISTAPYHTYNSSGTVAGSGHTYSLTSITDLPGVASGFQFAYPALDISDAAGMFARIEPSTHYSLPSDTTHYGTWINSDGSGHKISIRVTDASNITFQLLIGYLNWTGWRKVYVPLDRIAEEFHTGTTGTDVVMHPPFKLDSYLIVDHAGGVAQDGQITIAAPVVIEP